MPILFRYFLALLPPAMLVPRHRDAAGLRTRVADERLRDRLQRGLASLAPSGAAFIRMSRSAMRHPDSEAGRAWAGHW